MRVIVGVIRIGKKGQTGGAGGGGGASFRGGNAVGDFEAVAQHQFLVGEDPADGTIGPQLSFIEQEGAVAGIEDEFEVVTRDDSGDRQGIEDLPEFPASARVQVARGFVHEHDFGLHGEDAGDGNPPFLA